MRFISFSRASLLPSFSFFLILILTNFYFVMKQYYLQNNSSKSNFAGFLKDAASSAANLFTAFHASYTDIDEAAVTMRVALESNGTNYGSNGVEVAGTNKSVHKVKPQYLPFLKRGCKYAGVLTTLSDADQELSVYQYIKLPAGQYFVWGIANATKTDFYSPKITSAANEHVIFA